MMEAYPALVFTFFGAMLVLVVLVAWFRTRSEKYWRFFLGLFLAGFAVGICTMIFSASTSGEIRIPLRRSETYVSFYNNRGMYLGSLAAYVGAAAFFFRYSVMCFMGKNPWRPSAE